MGIRDLKEQFEKAGGKKSASEKLHKKFDNKVEESRERGLVDKEQGYKKLPAFKKKAKPVDDSPKMPKSSFTDKLAKTVKKDEKRRKVEGCQSTD